MSADQQLSWIVLPHGRSDAGLHVSIVLSVRLRSDSPAPTLGEFPDLLDWPARLLDPGFSLSLAFPDGTSGPVAVDLAGLDPTLWPAMFDAAVPVTPFVFDDHADRPLVSYSRTELLRFLRTTWTATLADSPAALPATLSSHNQEPAVIGLDQRLGQLLDNRLLSGLHGEDGGTELDDRLRSLLAVARREADRRRSGAEPRGGPPIEPLPDDGSVGQHFARVLAFHRRPAALQDFPDGPAAEAALRATVDVHQMLSALGDHPALLRRLGLVLDGVVDPALVPDADPATPGRLRALPSWTSLLPDGTSTDVQPWTSYVSARLGDRSVFSAAPRIPAATVTPVLLGLVELPAAEFSLDQVDVDGAALKTIAAAATVGHAAARPPGDVPVGEPDRSGLPSLRTGGLALVRRARPDALQQSFTRSLDLEQALGAGGSDGSGVVLTAEDLVRGHRLDILTDGGAARSLHERVVHYGLVRRPDEPVEVVDEGCFSTATAAPAVPPGTTPDPGSELYVAETVITWDGWSLAAPRPGRAVSRDPRAPDPEVPESQLQRPSNDAVTALGLEIAARAVGGTLPRLRFRSRYQVRIRAMDLAGNGPTAAEADDLLAAAADDPAFASVVLDSTEEHLRFEPVPPPVPVPRVPFQEGASLQRLVIRSDGDVSPEAWADAFAAGPDAASGHPDYLPVDERHLVPPKAAVELVERHRVVDQVLDQAVGADRAAAAAAVYPWLARESKTLADPDTGIVTSVDITAPDGTPQAYVVHAEDLIEVPYLADPLAVGAVLFDLPGRTDPLVVRFGEAVTPDGPGPQSLRLRLVGGDDAPGYDPGTRVVTVALPGAAQVTVQVAALLDEPELMGMLAWCRAELDGERYDRVVEAVKANRCWAMTPATALTLVHAVQRPLRAPEVITFSALPRGIGETRVPLSGLVGLDLQSTEQIDVTATWSETVDDLSLPGPVRRDGRAAVFSLPVRTALTGEGPGREWPYWVEGDRVVGFRTDLTPVRHLPLPLGHEFGDTKHRDVAYEITLSTPFREYFPPAWAAEPGMLTRSVTPSDDATLGVSVPSSTRPPPPHVLYAVPLMGWTQESDEAVGTTTRRRKGDAIRVYLARPWFTSGDGELLGVVVGSVIQVPGEATTPFVTLFGRDPARGSGPVESAQRGAFPAATAVGRSLPLIETSRPEVAAVDRVDVVGHEVAYDDATQRWFCDVLLETGSTVGATPGPALFPFVRLALVRYQPDATAGQEISTVATVDLVQTLPDRTLVVSRSPDQPDRLGITVTGVAAESYRSATRTVTGGAVSRVTARLERRNERILDDVLGWLPDDAVPEVELTRAAGTPAVWSGELPVPAEGGPAARLLVQEEEFWPAEAPGGGLDGRIGRVVYVDTLSL